MGVLSNLRNLFSGLPDFFKMFRDMFDCLPIVCRVLIYFGFGGVLLLYLVQMLRSK